jgi:hypothetical protein
MVRIFALYVLRGSSVRGSYRIAAEAATTGDAILQTRLANSLVQSIVAATGIVRNGQSQGKDRP